MLYTRVPAKRETEEAVFVSFQYSAILIQLSLVMEFVPRLMAMDLTQSKIDVAVAQVAYLDFYSNFAAEQGEFVRTDIIQEGLEVYVENQEKHYGDGAGLNQILATRELHGGQIRAFGLGIRRGERGVPVRNEISRRWKLDRVIRKIKATREVMERQLENWRRDVQRWNNSTQSMVWYDNSQSIEPDEFENVNDIMEEDEEEEQSAESEEGILVNTALGE